MSVSNPPDPATTHAARRAQFGVDVFVEDGVLGTAKVAAERWANLRSADTDDYLKRLLRFRKPRSKLHGERIERAFIQVVASHLVDFVRNGVVPKRAVSSIPSAVLMPKELAELVLQDGIRFVNSAITRFRQEQIGCTSYTWIAIGDGRDDPEHVARHGCVYRWSDAPPPGGHPGEDVDCRCSAEAALSSWEDLEQRVQTDPGSAAEQPAKPESFVRGFFSGLFGKW